MGIVIGFITLRYVRSGAVLRNRLKNLRCTTIHNHVGPVHIGGKTASQKPGHSADLLRAPSSFQRDDLLMSLVKVLSVLRPTYVSKNDLPPWSAWKLEGTEP